MTREEYLQEAANEITNLLAEPKLINYKNQAFAWKLNATFNRTFEESYLWRRAMFLATNSCFLIQHKMELKTAIKGLYECAEIYEYLSELREISLQYDKDYLSILAALCYDLAGYQANGFCVANRLGDYRLGSPDNSISLETDNFVLEQIKLILLKKIPLAFSKLMDNPPEGDYGHQLFANALKRWFDFILKSEESDYSDGLNAVYQHFLYSGNVYLSHLLFLFKTRVLVFDQRAIWHNLKQVDGIGANAQWRKYVKLLAHDSYDINSRREVGERKSLFEFWTSQIRAIESGLLSKDENFVVQMPTSAGKTFIAELLILKYLVKFPDKKCIYIAPFRALTTEKEADLSKYFAKLGISVSSLSGSYEIDEFQDVILSQTDVLVATPEKIDMLLRMNPDYFVDVSLVVVDEGHIIGDISTRASLLEFLIIRLRIRIPELRTLFISAVMPPANADEYAIWLSGQSSNVLRSLRHSDSRPNEEWEPTRKLISHFEWVGNAGDITFQNVVTEDEVTNARQGAKLYGYLKEKEFGNQFPVRNVKKEAAAGLAYKLSGEGSTLVFCAQVPRIESVGNALLAILSVTEPPDRFKYQNDKKSSHYAEMWYGSTSYITRCIHHGIGIHYGDMPEQVRNAVEDDFRSGNLSVMLSTNTIGQGLNLPIKNLIFYETQIGRVENRNQYVQYRDFWNIVGRAGRAGKETEGKIIFIINTSTDRKLYRNYINKDNIENAESFIFQVLNVFAEKRIDSKNFSEYISLLSESYLLDLVSEEFLGTEYESLIEEIINRSLFKVQIDKKGIDLIPLKAEFQAIFKSFEATPFETLAAFRLTGFSFKSNKIIYDFIESNQSDLQKILDLDNHYEICNWFLKLISDNELQEMADHKLEGLGINPAEYATVIKHWLNGDSLPNLLGIWQNSTDLDIVSFHIFLSKALYYLYPWGVSSFLNILAHKSGKKFQDLPQNIRSLPSYLKYGLSNNTACLARSLGVKSREVSLALFEYSGRLQEKEFIKWLSNLTRDEIESFEVSKFDKENLREISVKLTPRSNRTKSAHYEFSLKGTNFSTEWSIASTSVQPGDFLGYKRDAANPFDPYAIIITKNENTLGYVPREFSRIIATDIDIEAKDFTIIAIEVKDKGDFSEITARMSMVP